MQMPDVVVVLGFAIGAAFGVAGLLSGFCLMSGLRDYWTKDDGRKLRSYALALAVAVAGTQAVAGFGYVDIGKSLYLQPSFSAPLIFLGGLMFGLGMVLANGCASRALVLLGKGNLRSLLVVGIIAVAAQMTLKGLIAPARLAFLQWTQVTPANVSVPSLLGAAGIGESVAQIAAVLIVSGGLVAFAFSDRAFRRAYGQIAAGLVIGLLIVAGWLATGYFGADDFNPIPVTSLSFVAPLADTLQYAMFSTGLSLSFGVALALGVLAGSAATALLSGRFALEGFSSAPHMLRSTLGAALMGSGGAMAYGCSVGQGLTGLSTLALPSFIAVAGIVGGAALGIRRFAPVAALAAH
jgi:uncharacterized membrane protein YedE/YeeE